MFFSATTPPRMVTLVVMTALATLSLNMFLPSLNTMALDFGMDYAVMSLAVAGYLAMTAVVTLIVGPLSDRFGRRPVQIACLLIFIGASIGCLTSTSIEAFLLFRLCQTAVISGWTIALAAIRDLFTKQEAASRIGYVTMAMAVAPMLGPMIGGTIDSIFGWRAIFATYSILGIFVFLLVWTDLGETNKNPSRTFSKQFQNYPMLLKSGTFWGYALCQAFSVGTFYSFLVGAPLVAAETLGISASLLGFYLGMITGGFAFGSFLSGKLAQKMRLTSLILVGRATGMAGLVISLSLFLLGSETVLSFFIPVMLVGVGNGLTMPSTNAGAMSVMPNLAGSAAGLTGSLAVGLGAILTSFTGSVVGGEQGVYVLLSIMIFTIVAGTVAIVVVRLLEPTEPLPPKAA